MKSKQIVYGDKNGCFYDGACEYVINNMYPARPLKNFLWNEHTVADADQFGFGKSLANVNGFRRPLENGERLVYLKDEETGEFYSPNRNYSRADFDRFHCRVGLGYQKTVSEYEGVRMEFTTLVPSEGLGVVFNVLLENVGYKTKNDTLYFLIRPCANLTEHTSYGSADKDKDKDNRGIYYPHFAYLAPTEYGALYFASERKFTSYAVSKKDFCGEYGDFSSPEGIRNKKLPSKGTTFEDDYVAAVAVPCELAPGERRSFTFALATGRSYEESRSAAKKMAKTSFFNAELEKQKSLNAEYRDVFNVKLKGDGIIQSLVNIWLKRQLSLGKTWGRIYGKGFRDVMQDIAAFVSLDIPLARDRILYTLAKQYKNGNTIRMFEPDLLLPYNDGASWIPATICAYLKESGDFSILNEVVDYLDGGKDTVLSHVVKGVEYLLGDRGGHGLVLMRGGDWNDSLNGTGNGGVGESVWLSLATVKAAKECAEILGRVGDEKLKDEMLEKAARLSDDILNYGMSDGYFIYAYDDWGGIVGGKDCDEGKFYLNPQTWSVLAGVGDETTANRVMDEVEKRLKCSFGYTLCTPPYTRGSDRLGRVSYFVPGMVENGAVYVHGVMFKIAADCKLGRADNAYETLKSVIYTNPKVRQSGVEPYAVTNMFIGPSNPYRAGDAPMSWVTGSAGWAYRNITELILGVRADYDGLEISPNMPSAWKEAEVERIFRGTKYKIHYIRTGKNAITVDGKIIDGNVIPLTDKKTVNVQVEIA